ncbi:MAG: hypothetical protein HDS64_05995 [Bacteroidales bacterium]|nr:hypothetical protein [Bacteroidales bacterium]
MRYTKNDIPNIPLTEFMAALDEKPVKSFDNLKLYYAPYRDDQEPMLVVDTNTNRWYDHATEQKGDIIDLAALKMNPMLYMDPRDFIIKYMNEYQQGKELRESTSRGIKPTTIQLDISKIRLTDFMKALGQAHPVAADGNLRRYNAPYSDKPEPTMVINIETNQWRDTKSGAYGGIYDLAYELTGSCNMSELNLYIAGEMKTLEKQNSVKVEPQKNEPEQPKRRMRL